MSIKKKISTKTTIARIVEMLDEDGFTPEARDAGYRDTDSLPRCAPYERPTPEAVRGRDQRAIRRTAREIKIAHGRGALIWTLYAIRTTDVSRLDLRSVDAPEDRSVIE